MDLQLSLLLGPSSLMVAFSQSEAIVEKAAPAVVAIAVAAVLVAGVTH
jgi:hypothetical protein